MSLCRQNYHEDCEAAVNKQINMELHASYVYDSLAIHFDRDDVALKGFHEFFKKSASEEREHAQMFIKYQSQRGGRVILKDIKAPEKASWDSGLEAMQDALDLEKNVNQALLKLHAVSTAHDDPHLCDFLEGEFLKEQVEAIKQLSEYVTNLKRAGPGLGEYLFDKETLSS